MTSQAAAGAAVQGGDAARAVAALRRFRREPEVLERCELCSAPLSPHPGHEHLFEHANGQVHCSCTPCAILFPVEVRKRYLRIPQEIWKLENFGMSDMQWDSLAIPVHMAYVSLSADSGEPRAYYPSPAGATESLLSIDGWEELVQANPALRRIVPGVQALLINRIGQARDHYIAPIDRCFELVGLIRTNWRGLSGGTEVWEKVGRYFAALDAQSFVLETAAGA